MAVTHNFFIDQGSDFAITFIYQDVNGNRINLNDGTVVFRFKDKASSTADTYEYIRGAPDEYVSQGDPGEIKIAFPASLTQTFTFANALYDLDFQPDPQNPSDPISNIRIATGTITLIQKNFNTFVGQVDPPDTGGTDPNVISPVISDGDQCSTAVSCVELDIYSVVYNGGEIAIFDNQDNSGIIEVADETRLIDKVEVIINNLKHDSPQDLTFLLWPPSGDTVLLSSSNKITNYSQENYPNGFSFIFSNRANQNIFLNNVQNNGLCNIEDKTDITQYSGHTLTSSFDHLIGHPVTGSYVLYANDNDVFGSGSIGSWDLIITYQ